MGVFSDNVRKYYESGIITIPCKDKRPVVGKEWQQYCIQKPTEEQITKWEATYKDVNQLGLTLGSATLLSGFDFDYEWNEKRSTISKAEFDKDRRLIERQILAILPPTPCVKTGRKGWTRIYRSHGALENAQADRNGVRLFDFLARNKQTIIPPSIYSDDSDLKYRWTGVPIEDCLDDLGIITQEHIEEIKFLLGEKVEDNSRHMKLFRWIIRQSIIDPDPNVIAKKAVEHDKVINQPPYLSDKKHHPKGDAESNALYWVKRIVKWKDSKPNSKDYKLIESIKSSREMYFQFFEQNLGKHKVDLMSDRLMIDVKTKTEYETESNRWRPALNMIAKLRSDALEVDLKREFVEDHLHAYKESLTPGFLFEIPDWDGRDRIAEVLKLAPAVNLVGVHENGEALYLEIIKDIAAGIFRRAFNSLEQNLFTIIRGPQGAGKNVFIEKMFMSPFSHYSAEVTVGQDMAKNFDAVEGRLVCTIGEFDQTQKVQVSFIKELITNASFTARRAYERTSDRYELRQTFFSASNFDNVLKDTSGNRRYVIWDIPTIDWSYSSLCDPDQLRAQYYALYKSKFRMSDEAKAWIKAFNFEETPDDPVELAFESYESRVREIKEPFSEWLDAERVSEIINNVCKENAVPVSRLRATLKRRKLSKRSNGTKYLNLSKCCPEVYAAWRKSW